MKKTRLIDTNELGGAYIIKREKSIFNVISSIVGQPFEWLTQTNADTLDIEYYMNHSGQKVISPMFHILLDLNDGDVNDTLKTLANTLILKFNDKWNKLYEAFIESEYKPLENYSMEETETPNITKDSTETTKTKIETETENDTTEARIHGFNSTDAVPSGETERNGKVIVTANENDNEVHNVQTETGDRKLERHGNIGITSSQQMLQMEIDLRRAFNFVNEVMSDVDSVMTLDVYIN